MPQLISTIHNHNIFLACFLQLTWHVHIHRIKTIFGHIYTSYRPAHYWICQMPFLISHLCINYITMLMTSYQVLSSLSIHYPLISIPANKYPPPPGVSLDILILTEYQGYPTIPLSINWGITCNDIQVLATTEASLMWSKTRTPWSSSTSPYPCWSWMWCFVTTMCSRILDWRGSCWKPCPSSTGRITWNPSVWLWRGWLLYSNRSLNLLITG